MAEKFQFTRYNEPMIEICKDLNPVQVFEYEGMDISDIAEFDLGGEECFLKCYKTDKVEKIISSKINLYGGMVAAATIIVPAPDYDLPSYVSDWDESEDHLHGIIDFVPADDPGRNTEYLTDYLYNPLEKIYKKYCEIPGLRPNVFHWVRAYQSPYMITGIIKPTKPVQDFFACTQEYLKAWIEIWKAAKRKDPSSDYMKLVHERRHNIRETYRYNDPGEGPLTKILGKEKARKILNTLMP